MRDATARLIHALHDRTPFLWHRYDDGTGVCQNSPLADDGIHFTTDFIVKQDYSLLFLEGGPLHELGAHPCCFHPGEIAGVVLTAPA